MSCECGHVSRCDAVRADDEQFGPCFLPSGAELGRREPLCGSSAQYSTVSNYLLDVCVSA